MLRLYKKIRSKKRRTTLLEMLKFMVRLSAVSAILLSVMLSVPLLASAESIRDYCEREFAEIADYCVAQERAAQELIEASDADPFILSMCREAFPDSYALQDACITIKSDQARGLRSARPGLGI